MLWPILVTFVGAPAAAAPFFRLPSGFLNGFLSVPPRAPILFDGFVGIVAGLFRVSPVEVMLRPGQHLVHLFLTLGV